MEVRTENDGVARSEPSTSGKPAAQRIACAMCGELCVQDDDDTAWGVCSSCARRLPPSLVKAINDPFFYALRLRTGEVICFERCTIYGEWVRLTVDYDSAGRLPPHLKLDYFCLEYGLDVRLSDIVWCAAAPNGS